MSLSSLFVVGNALRLRRFKSHSYEEGKDLEEQNKLENEKKKEERKMNKIMTSEGMMCGHCTGRVQKALEEIPGVEGVTMSLENKSAEVILDGQVTDEMLKAAVTEAGYEVTQIK